MSKYDYLSYMLNASPDNLSLDAMRWSPDTEVKNSAMCNTPSVIHAPQLSDEWPSVDDEDDDEPIYMEEEWY